MRCPGCGNPRDETMQDERLNPEIAKHYDAKAYVCFACQAADLKKAEFQDSKHAPTAGLYVFPIKRR